MAIDYDLVEYAPTAERKEWFEAKFTLGLDFPNVPYFIDIDGTKLTEVRAIMKYCAKKWKP